MSIKGIGSAKAITLMAALELGRRRRICDVIDRFKISSSLDVFELMKPLSEVLHIEQFWTLYLNNSNKVLSKLKISVGGVDTNGSRYKINFKTCARIKCDIYCA